MAVQHGIWRIGSKPEPLKPVKLDTELLLEQQIGRLRRHAKGKERGIFIDLQFRGMSHRTRDKTYRNMVTPDSVTSMTNDEIITTLKEKLN